ncbi:hypothetical protein ACSS6W_002694 [Trichoderma asperelloides]
MKLKRRVIGVQAPDSGVLQRSARNHEEDDIDRDWPRPSLRREARQAQSWPPTGPKLILDSGQYKIGEEKGTQFEGWLGLAG